MKWNGWVVSGSLAMSLMVTACTPSATVKANVDTSVEAEWRVMMLDQCPQTPDQAPRALSIVDGLIGLGVDWIFDAVGSALEAAAKENKEGLLTSTTHASYLYLRAYAGSAAPGQTRPEANKLLQCLIIAKSTSGPDEWCKLPPFTSETMCNDAGIHRLNGELMVSVDSGWIRPFAPSVEAWPKGKGLPDFYAEIQLRPASDERGYLPELATLYYPKGVHNKKPFSTNAPRQLIISASATTPGGDAAISSIVSTLAAAVPSNELVTTKNGSAQLAPAIPGLWVAVASVPEKGKVPPATSAFFPINLKAEVREIGPENKFLQMLAKAFGAQKAALADKVKDRVVPGRVDAAEAAAEALGVSNSIKYSEAVALVQKSLGALGDQCKDPAALANLSGAGAAAAASKIYEQYQTAYAAILKANVIAATIPNLTPTAFTPDLLKIKLNGSVPAELCKQLLY